MAMAEQIPIQFEHHCPLSDRWFETRCDPSPEGLTVPAADTTDHLLAQQAVERLNHDLRRKLNELRTAKDEFLAMLAHELRNPLAPSRNAVQALQRLGPAEPRLQWVREAVDRPVETRPHGRRRFGK
jgi:signal transduction histidine kinase